MKSKETVMIGETMVGQEKNCKTCKNLIVCTDGSWECRIIGDKELSCNKPEINCKCYEGCGDDKRIKNQVKEELMDSLIASLTAEKRELDGKIGRLSAFLVEDGRSLTDEYYWLLVNQQRAMEIYSSMLKFRIEVLRTTSVWQDNA